MSPAIRNAVIPPLVAVGLGPLVAGLAFIVASFVVTIVGYLTDPETAMPVGDLLTWSMFYILFAYFEGWSIALLAGILVSIGMIWTRPGLLLAVAAAIGSVLIHRVAMMAGAPDASGRTLVMLNFWLAMGISVFAAIGCWFIMRRFDTTT